MIEITKENYDPKIIIKNNPFKQFMKNMLKIQEAIKNENHKIESEFDKVISEITSQKM
jgi:cell division GTPase FtsZ